MRDEPSRVGLSTRLWLCILAAAVAVSPPNPLGGPAQNLSFPISGAGSVTALDAVAALAVAVVALKRPHLIRPERLIYFALIAVISTRVLSIFAFPGFDWYQFFSVFRYLQTLIVIYIVSHSVDRPARFRFFLRAVTGVALIEAAGDVATYLATGERGLFLSLTNLRWMGVIAVVLTTRGLRGSLHFKDAIGLLIVSSGFIANQTRSAVIVPWVCVLGIALTRITAAKAIRLVGYISASLLVLFCIALLLPEATGAWRDRFLAVTRAEAGTVNERLYLWSQAAGYFFQSPIVGIGSGRFARQNLDTEVPEVLRIELAGEYRGKMGGLSTHSNVLSVLSETGVVGLLAYIGWVWAVLAMCRAALRFSNRDPAILGLAAFVGVSVLSDIWYQGSFENGVSCMIGMLVGFLRTTPVRKCALEVLARSTPRSTVWLSFRS